MIQKRRVVYIDDATWADLIARATAQQTTISHLLRDAARDPIATRLRPEAPTTTMISYSYSEPPVTPHVTRSRPAPDGQSVLFTPAPKPVPAAKPKRGSR